MTKVIKIGAGAGFSEDWVEPAEDLAKYEKLDYLIFEALAERTIHDCHIRRQQKINPGYGLRFEERMKRCAIRCLEKGTKIITNDGAANPRAAAEWLQKFLYENNVSAKIAIVEGDDVFDYYQKYRNEIFSAERYQVLTASDAWLPTDPEIIKDNLRFANVYLYHDPIREALSKGADIVITGRVADPSLFVAAILHEFNWSENDWNKIGFGTVVGHLLECSGHATGGYFADEDKKFAYDLANMGFPIAEVSDDETVVITKLPNSGGRVCRETILEQLHYEIHDFSTYVTPDVIADFSHVQVEEIGENRVKITGCRGREKPKTLKALLSYHHGYTIETSIRYRGHGALTRAKMAADIWQEKLRHANTQVQHSAFLFNDLPYEAALREDPNSKYIEFRYSGILREKIDAEHVGLYFMGLYLNGPYGGGGIEHHVNIYDPIIPLLIDREEVKSHVTFLETSL
jgi:hypothetical protein